MKNLNEQTQSARVSVFIPKGSRKDDVNLFVSVNGSNYLLPRGKTSFVPQCVAFEIERAAAAEERSEKYTEERTAQ